MHRLLVSAAIAAGFAAGLAAQTITLPAAAAGVEGSGSNNFPWGYTGTAFPGLHIQTIYDSSNLTSQGIVGRILITRIRWRCNGGAAPLGGTFAQSTISMGTAAVDYLAASTTYASNQGADFGVVYQGPITVAAASASTPGAWYVDVPLTTPFCYDPTTGNDLIIDTDHATAGNWSGAGSATNDTSSSLASRVYASSLYPAANGVDFGSNPVVELTYVTATGTTLTTPPNFVSNNSGGSGGCIYFTLNVLAPNGISISTIDINTLSPASTSLSGKVYLHRSISDWNLLSGNNNLSRDWNVIGMLTGTAAGPNLPSAMAVHNFTNSIDLPPGSYLLAIGGGNFANAYTNGNGINQNAFDCNVMFQGGKAANTVFDSSLFNPRVLNGTFHYALPGSLVSRSPSIDPTCAVNGNGCGGAATHVRENFTAVNTFDIAGTDLFLTSGGFAPLAQTAITAPFSANLGLSDDSSTPFFPLGFHLTLGNDVYDRISICSNGYIRLDAISSGTDFSPSDSEFFGQGARLCPYWDDLDPSAGGTVHCDITAGQAVITYNQVFLFGTATPVTFQVVITPNSVLYRYDPASAWPAGPALALVGYANGVTEAANAQVNFTAGPTAALTGAGNLVLLCDQAPGIGVPFQMTLANNGSIGAVLAQFGPANLGALLPAPFAAGCRQYVNNGAVSLGISFSQVTPFSVNVPNSFVWLGLPFGCQGFSLGNGSTFLSSNGLTGTVGSF